MKPKKDTNKGQGLVEYIALTALIAIVSIGAVKVLGSKVHRRLTQITTRFDRSIQQGLKKKTSKKAPKKQTNKKDDDEFFKLPW